MPVINGIEAVGKIKAGFPQRLVEGSRFSSRAVLPKWEEVFLLFWRKKQHTFK